MDSYHSGRTTSIWMATEELPGCEPLQHDTTADVIIVGAGIAGLTTAYLLGREGRKVIVIDDGPIVSGETERTTAHLASAMDDRFIQLEKIHGEKGAKLAAESHAAAIDQIESIVKRENIGCDFERLDGYLFLAPGDPPDLLMREHAAARRAGLAGCELVAGAPVQSFNTGAALRFPNQGQFHPLKYLAALANIVRRQGGQIFAHTRAVEIHGGDAAGIETDAGYRVTARAVVVATNTPVNDRFKIHTKQAAYRTYVIGARIRSGAVPKALYWDTGDPYHYVRLQTLREPAGHEVLIVGGEDHKTGQADDGRERFARLEAWTRERFPIVEVQFRWSGQVMEPVDYLGFIGRNPGDDDNVFIATGDSGQGMTHGTIAGMLLTDLIAGRENPWTKLYDPSRKTPTGEFARENLNVAARYADYVSPGDTSDVDSIPLDSGAVIRRGLRKVAVYRDSHGQLHELSAVCPHLGCIVSWNAVEKTWDCPCHGSRFHCEGEVVNGPANKSLSAIEQPAEAHAHS